LNFLKFHTSGAAGLKNSQSDRKRNFLNVVSYEVFGLSEPEAGLEAAPAGSRPATSRMCIELSRQELPFLDDEYDDEDEQENNDNNPFKFRPKNDDIITIAFHFNHK
jgi:hypothetical protein